MINYTELRLGNLFSNSQGNIQEVTIETLQYLLNDSFQPNNESVNPIPINRELLLKFGFSESVRPNSADLYKDLSTRMFLLFNDGDCAKMDLIQDDKMISFKHAHIKYVHQLQNFVFSLTGKELEFKIM